MKKAQGFSCISGEDFGELDLVKVKGGYVLNMPLSWRNGVVFKFKGFEKGQLPKKGDPLWVIFSEETRVQYSESAEGTEKVIRTLVDEVTIEAGSLENPYGVRKVVTIAPFRGELTPNKRGNILTLSVLSENSVVDDYLVVEGDIAKCFAGYCSSATGRTRIVHFVLVHSGSVKIVSGTENKRIGG